MPDPAASRRTRRLSRRQKLRIRETREARRRSARDRVARTSTSDCVGSEATERVGLVIANHGASVAVEDDDGDLHRCSMRQHLERAVAGDRVFWREAGPREGIVTAIEVRRSILARPDYLGSARPIAANIDQILIVVAPIPEMDEALVDRYLAAAATMGVSAAIVLNKSDLLCDPRFRSTRDRIRTYEAIGFAIVESSGRLAGGLIDLRRALGEHTNVLVGQSGVGKSSLVNELLPDQAVRVRAISETTGRGTHTTSETTLYHLPAGGDLIDSPGVRSFEPNLTTEQVDLGFPEFQELLGKCRFSNCSHTVEPGCALLRACQSGQIRGSRLTSYCQLKEAARIRAAAPRTDS